MKQHSITKGYRVKEIIMHVISFFHSLKTDSEQRVVRLTKRKKKKTFKKFKLYQKILKFKHKFYVRDVEREQETF